MAKKNCTNIGGQAVIEGVMMRGTRSMATACRNEKGEIVVESKYIKPVKEKSFIYRTPFIRGFFNFISTMGTGVGTLMRSGEVYAGEEEPSKVEKWFAKTFKVDVLSVIMVFSVILGLALSVGLFFVLPSLITSGITKLFSIDESVKWVMFLMNLLEGIIRILIFVLYIWLTSLMKDVRRTYMYHGSEHKTISAYEHGLDLTVENVQTMTTVHDRCGTTFMFIIMVVSVLLFSLTSWLLAIMNVGNNVWIKVLVRIVLLPLVASVSYEVLKFLAKYDNPLVRALKAPGLWLQKLTTKQPDDSMVEVAITAFNTVLAMDSDNTIPEQRFDTNRLYKNVRKKLEEILPADKFDASDIDWIVCLTAKVNRSELSKLTIVKESQEKKMYEIANRRKNGEPLWQIIGNTDFYGIEIEINDKVLCPRPETEELVHTALKSVKGGERVLDLCCGSGCIGIAMAKNADVSVVCSDISEDAVELTNKNVNKLELTDKITVVKGDLFENITDKFDIIISNPPYINSADIENLDTEVKDHEPHIALDGGEDGLDFYRTIIAKANDYLSENGVIYFECGINQASSICDIAGENGYVAEVTKDIQGIERIINIKKL